MKITFCHLSDIHFSNLRENSILEKKQKLIDAILSNLNRDSILFFIVSGDIAQSGNKYEYEIALDFFCDISSKIVSSRNIEIHFIFVPGNHDCKFPTDNTLIKNADSMRNDVRISNSTDLINKLCLAQINYRDFVNVFDKHRIINDLLSQKEFQIKEKKILFNLINSSWISQKDEKVGDIYIPTSQFEKIEKDKYDYVISVLHHPFEWFSVDNRLSFEKYITKISDIIFVGHEHIGEDEKVISRDSIYECHYGEVLQDVKDSNNSAFTIITYDLEKKVDNKEVIYRWNCNMYCKQELVEPLASSKDNLYKIDFLEFINNPNIDIMHMYKDPVRIKDLYIYPNIQINSDKILSDKRLPIVKGTELFEYIGKQKSILITGECFTGKTALCKMLYLDYIEAGYYPLYLDGSKINTSHLNKMEQLLYSKIVEQVNDEYIEIYEQTDRKFKVLLIDDFDKCNLNDSSKKYIINYLQDKFDINIIFSNIAYEIEVLRDSIDQVNNYFCQGNICEMGPSSRHKLIRKWYYLGRETVISEEELIRYIQMAEQTINTLKGDGCFPTIPAHILIILQQLDIAQSKQDGMSSYGHLFDFLISRSIIRIGANVNQDITAGYLMELAYYMFKIGKKSLTGNDISNITNYYNKEYNKEIDSGTYINELIDVNLLSKYGDELVFAYPYIYYYYVAKYLSSYISEEEVYKKIEYMSRRLFNEDYGNIMVFLCHLTKDYKIINYLIENSMILFNDIEKCNFEVQQEFLIDMDKDVSDFVEINFNPEKNLEDRKNEYYIKKDEDELLEMEEYDRLKDFKEITEDPYVNKMLQINNAFKTMEVMGQILKNYPGTVKGKMQDELVKNVHDLGMRTLSFTYTVIKESIEPLINKIQQKLQLQNSPSELRELISISNKEISKITFVISYGMIRKIAFCLSNEGLITTIEKSELSNVLSYKLVKKSIYLNNLDKLHGEEVIKIHDCLIESKNNFADSMLRKMVIDHYYFFGSKDSNTRQRVCDKLDIKISNSSLLVNKH